MTSRVAAGASLDPAPIAWLAASPQELEPALADAVARHARRALFTKIALVAPTRRLLDHLAQELTSRQGALVGVHFLHYRGLAEHLLEERSTPALRVVEPVLLGVLFARRIATIDHPLARYLERQPSAIGALLATLRDLRDAGFSSAELAPTAELTARGRATLELFRHFEELLAELLQRGRGDGAALTQAALATLNDGPPPFDALLHYGAYEVIGTHLELLRRIAARAPTELFVPDPHGVPDAPPRALAHQFAAAPRPLAATSRTAPAIECTSFAGPREELRFAVRQLLAWHRDDQVPLREMAVLVRSAGPFVRALAAESELGDLAADASFAPPLSSVPAAAKLLPLLHALAEPDSPPVERRARRIWRERKLDPLLQQFADARTLTDRLDRLRPWIDAVASSEITTWFEAVANDLRALEPLLAIEGGPPFGSVGLAGLLRERLRSTPLPLQQERVGALQVLDFHQARGLPFRRAIIVGANEKLLPRRSGDDFFLGDGDRAALRAASGRPIPLRSSDRRDEELLFDVVRAAIDERLVVTFARSDENGRAAAPSPFLRRLAVATKPTLVPRHPLREVEALHARTRLLRSTEALLLAASASVDAARRVARLVEPNAARRGDLERALDAMDAIDAYKAGPLRFDGSAISVRAKEHWTPSELQTIGRCPLQYFFARELRLKPLDEESEDGELRPSVVGELFHRVLRALYVSVVPRDGIVDVATALAAARSQLPKLLASQLDELDLTRQLHASLRPLRLAQWRDELLSFVAIDFQRIADEKWKPVGFELPMRTELVLRGRRVAVDLRFDRVLADAAGHEWIGDYKYTAHDELKKRVSVRLALAGKELQLPLYALARSLDGRVVQALEFLAVKRARGETADEAGRFVAVNVEQLASAREELLQTLAVLVELRERGTFPLSPDLDRDRGHCGRCDFRRACRHHHAATLARVLGAPEHRAYFDLGAKP